MRVLRVCGQMFRDRILTISFIRLRFVGSSGYEFFSSLFNKAL